MKKIMYVLLAGMILVPGLFADDGEYDMPDLETLAQKDRVVRKVNVSSTNISMSTDVKKNVTECNALNSKQKIAESSLSKAYEANNPKEIRKQEFNVWYLKGKITIAEKTKDFAYLLAELKKMYNEYPDSVELKNLVLKTQQETVIYIKNANKIIELESKQRLLGEKLAKVQKIGLIIHQKVKLQKLQDDFNNS